MTIKNKLSLDYIEEFHKVEFYMKEAAKNLSQLIQFWNKGNSDIFAAWKTAMKHYLLTSNCYYITGTNIAVAN